MLKRAERPKSPLSTTPRCSTKIAAVINYRRITNEPGAGRKQKQKQETKRLCGRHNKSWLSATIIDCRRGCLPYIEQPLQLLCLVLPSFHILYTDPVPQYGHQRNTPAKPHTVSRALYYQLSKCHYNMYREVQQQKPSRLLLLMFARFLDFLSFPFLSQRSSNVPNKQPVPHLSVYEVCICFYNFYDLPAVYLRPT